MYLRGLVKLVGKQNSIYFGLLGHVKFSWTLADSLISRNILSFVSPRVSQITSSTLKVITMFYLEPSPRSIEGIEWCIVSTRVSFLWPSTLSTLSVTTVPDVELGTTQENPHTLFYL
jgi:hypothetical protein